MKNITLHISRYCLSALMLLLICINSKAQYKEYKLSPTGDTLNAIDKKGLKQGKWVVTTGEIRGEPGYDEEGLYKNDQKTGIWRRYNNEGDIIAVENYLFGGKDGLQQYFTYLGTLLRQEEWRGYNPDAPYDTIAVYGTGSNEIVDYKIVKAQQYSVPNGEWKYFEAGSGRLVKVEKYDRGLLLKDNQEKKPAATATPTAEKAKPAKPQEMLNYEKNNSKKKKKALERDGRTAL